MKAVIHTVTAWDVAFFNNVFRLGAQPGYVNSVTKLMLWITRSADGHFYPLAAPLVLAVRPDHLGPFLIGAAIAFGLELPTYAIVKKSVKRDRPFQAIEGVIHRVIPPDQFSFPSGHTGAAFVMAVLTGYHIPALAPFLFVWACAVGFSRIYLGVHYPSDVFAGALLGSVSAAIALALSV